MKIASITALAFVAAAMLSACNKSEDATPAAPAAAATAAPAAASTAAGQ
jgi:nitrous oxide reductase accessory protein NosL